MASSDFVDETIQSESAFPEADVAAELHPSKTHDFPIDPISSDVSETKDLEKEPEVKVDDGMASWKSAIVISGVAVVVIAAAVVISKKLKSKDA